MLKSLRPFLSVVIFVMAFFLWLGGEFLFNRPLTKSSFADASFGALIFAVLTVLTTPTGKGRKSFSKIERSTFTIRRSRPGSILYEESGKSFIVNTADGEGSYLVQIEDMGAVDVKLDMLPVTEKLHIARNIRDALLQRGVDAEVCYEHRPVRD